MENADSVIRLALWGKGVNQYNRSLFSWSPHGDLIAVVSSIGIFIYDSSSLNEIRFIETTGNALSVAFSPDGTALAVGFWDGSIQFWRPSDGSLLQTLREEIYCEPDCGDMQPEPVEEVAFSQDGTILVSSFSNGYHIWEVSDGSLLDYTESSSRRSVTISPNGEIFAYFPEDTTTLEETIRIESLLDNSFTQTIEIPPAPDGTPFGGILAFSRDGATLAAGGYGRIYLWNVIDGELLKTLETENNCMSLSFSPDGGVLVSGIEYGSGTNVNEYEIRYGIDVWKIDDGTRSTRINSSEIPRNLAFSPDGAIFAFGSANGIIELLNTMDWQPVGKIESQPLISPKIIFSSEENSLYSWTLEGIINKWDITDGTIQETFRPVTEGERTSMAMLSPDASVFVNCVPLLNVLHFWRTRDGTLLSPDWEVGLYYPRDWENFEPNRVTSMVISPKENLVALGYNLGYIEIWAVNGSPRYKFTQSHSGMVTSLAFTSGNEIVASASDQGEIFIWKAPEDISEDINPIILAGHENYVESITFSPDDTLLASGAGNEIRLWRTTDGSLIYSVNVPEMNITGVYAITDAGTSLNSIAFSPDGTILAYGRLGIIYLLRTSDGTLMQTLEGHTDSITSLKFSRDGLILASGSADGTIRLWGIAP